MHVMAICDCLTERVLSPVTGSSIFFHKINTKIHQYTIKFHCHNELVCFCWLPFPDQLVIHMKGVGP